MRHHHIQDGINFQINKIAHRANRNSENQNGRLEKLMDYLEGTATIFDIPGTMLTIRDQEVLNERSRFADAWNVIGNEMKRTIMRSKLTIKPQQGQQ